MMPLVDFLRLRRDKPHIQTLQAPIDHEVAFYSMADFFGLNSFCGIFKFSGIRQNVPIDDLNGWTMIFCEKYSHKTTLANCQPPSNLAGGTLLFAARSVGSKTLAVAAMGAAGVLTSQTRGNATRLHNGVHWYCNINKAIGFAPNSCVCLDASDHAEAGSPERLSWCLSGLGGMRAGTVRWLNESTDWEKVIFATPVNLFP